MKKYFTTHEVARMCQVSRGSVIRWINEGKISTATTIGGHNRIGLEDVQKLLKELRLPAPAEWAPLPSGAPKILIVDDEEKFCLMLIDYLSRNFPEWKVEKAYDGFEAGLKIESWKPDLVVLDLMISGMDGFRVCEMIRNRESSRHIKIVAVSGHSNPGFGEKILSLGADEFLAKPFSLEMFKETLGRHIDFVSGTEKVRKAS